MANRTSWVAGNGAGLTWSLAFTSGNVNTATANGSSMLSSTTITNGTALDMFMDISYTITIASSTIVAGANFAFWLYTLNQDGTTFGDNQLTAGTAAAITPSFSPCAIVPVFAKAATTSMVGLAQGILIPPGSFALAYQNNCGFAQATTGNSISYRTYNINLNA